MKITELLDTEYEWKWVRHSRSMHKAYFEVPDGRGFEVIFGVVPQFKNGWYVMFKDNEDYWQVADNIRNIYMSDGSLDTLLDFERVLDEVDIYAFRNWYMGELVSGPKIGKYKVTVTFMWPERLMPDPRGARRLLPFDCEVSYQRKKIKIPIRITDPSDYEPGTKKARIMEKTVWLVSITMPKNLMSDIRTGSIQMADEEIDLEIGRASCRERV